MPGSNACNLEFVQLCYIQIQAELDVSPLTYVVPRLCCLISVCHKKVITSEGIEVAPQAPLDLKSELLIYVPHSILPLYVR